MNEQRQNRKRVALSNAAWVTMGIDWEISPADIPILEEVTDLVKRMQNQKVHAVHLNQDLNDPKKLHSVNIVFRKPEREE